MESYVNKFMIGRLLQAAWYSPQKTKRFGIEEAIKFVPLIRKRLIDIIKKTKGSIPEIAADILILFLSDFSLRSAFLQQEVIECFEQIQQEPSVNDNLYMMVALLWTLQKTLPEDKISDMINCYCAKIQLVLISGG